MGTSKKHNDTKQWMNEESNNLKSIGRSQTSLSGDDRIYSELSRARALQRKYDSRRGNFSFYIPRNKMLVRKNFFYFVVPGFKAETISLLLTKYTERYSVKLNSLSDDIIYVLFGFILTKPFKDFFYS